MTSTDWQTELGRLGGAGLPVDAATPVVSQILKLTGRDVGVVAAARLSGAPRPVELQVRRVLAGRYGQENFVALAVLEAPAVRGSATLRAGQLYTFARFFRDSPWWQKLFLLAALPLGIPLMLPGYVLVVGLATLAKRASGIWTYGSVATEPGFRARFVVEARSRGEAQAAVPASLQRALVESDGAVRVELTPGRAVVERRLAGPELLAPFVRDVVSRLSASVG